MQIRKEAPRPDEDWERDRLAWNLPRLESPTGVPKRSQEAVDEDEDGDGERDAEPFAGGGMTSPDM
jgi:hypothetical protein